MGCNRCGALVSCGCSSTSNNCNGNPCGAPSCGSNPSPTPYYENTPQCQENHCQEINNYLFNTTISPDNSWNVPLCGQLVTFVVGDLNTFHIGAYIWSDTYGYYEVVGFDRNTHQLTVINNCIEGNAAPGTKVEACSLFIVVDPPLEAGGNSGQVCLELDFTAPAVNACVLITVTNIGTLVAGDTVRIGSGTYRVSSIDSATTITICNDGEGITPGSPVVAKNGAGQYQYCLVVISNCCATLSEEITNINEEIDALSSSISTTITNVNQLITNFGGTLPTPCSDYKNTADSNSSGDLVTVPELIAPQASFTTTTTSYSTTNTTCRDFKILSIIQVDWDYVLDSEFEANCLWTNVKIERRINAGAWNTLYDRTVADFFCDGNGFGNLGDYRQSYQRVLHEFFNVIPTASLSVEVKVTFTNNNALTGDSVYLDDYQVQVFALIIGL